MSTKMHTGAKETRLYRYDTKLLDEYCKLHQFYQNINGIVIPCTPELIVNYFHLRRRSGPEEVKVKFIDITNSLITDVKKFVPIRNKNNEEEWIEKFDPS